MPTSILKKSYEITYQGAVKNKGGVGWVLTLIVTALILVSYQTDIFSRLEFLTLDYRFNMRYVGMSPQDIVFIDMAEDSINAIGRWPWPRKWHATLIKILEQYHPKAIAFDVIFSEPQDEIDDTVLEEAIRQSGIVYMPSIYDIETDKVMALYKGDGVTSIHEPLPRFITQLRGSGHINATSDTDGILRRVPPVISFKGRTTYQLGISIAAGILGIGDDDISFDPVRHRMTLKKQGGSLIEVPLDKNNLLIVNWLGKWGNEFNHYSYIDVITSYAAIRQGKKPIIDLTVFKDKICIVGLTAAGLIDIKPIPIESAYPAVGTNAMIASGILHRGFIREVPAWMDFMLIIVVSIGTTFALCNLRLLSGIILAVILTVCYALFSIALFVIFNIIVVTFYPILAIAFAYVLTASYTQVLQSVERSNLFRQATRDGLTQLYNIRHFNLLLESEFRSASVLKFRSLSLIMCDLDNFKHVNDTYGHQAGDLVLKETAQIIMSKCRQLDVVGRYGGEEFIIMLSGAKVKDAAVMAEKIRLAVEAKKFKFDNVAYSTTISLGVVEYSDEKTKSELVEKADKALYNSKKTGKNKVTIYSADMRETAA